MMSFSVSAIAYLKKVIGMSFLENFFQKLIIGGDFTINKISNQAFDSMTDIINLQYILTIDNSKKKLTENYFIVNVSLS